MNKFTKHFTTCGNDYASSYALTTYIPKVLEKPKKSGTIY